jgi:hypothetical protein
MIRLNGERSTGLGLPLCLTLGGGLGQPRQRLVSNRRTQRLEGLGPSCAPAEDESKHGTTPPGSKLGCLG